MMSPLVNQPSDTCVATLAGGCFWCLDAVFRQLDGVVEVLCGYSGGHADNPTYAQVCAGYTGHAEVVQIRFLPKVISFAELLEVFFRVHDPTQLNRQGNDIGSQYRSAIFCHDDYQRQVAEEYRDQLNSAGVWSDPVVTEITAISNFYNAEVYHQDYYTDNGNQPYCANVIRPKIEKFRKSFSSRLKNDPE